MRSQQTTCMHQSLQLPLTCKTNGSKHAWEANDRAITELHQPQAQALKDNKAVVILTSRQHLHFLSANYINTNTTKQIKTMNTAQARFPSKNTPTCLPKAPTATAATPSPAAAPTPRYVCPGTATYTPYTRSPYNNHPSQPTPKEKITKSDQDTKKNRATATTAATRARPPATRTPTTTPTPTAATTTPTPTVSNRPRKRERFAFDASVKAARADSFSFFRSQVPPTTTAAPATAHPVLVGRQQWRKVGGGRRGLWSEWEIVMGYL